MLMNLLGQLSAIAQYNDAAYSGMQARNAQLGMMRGIKINSGAPAQDTFSKTNFGSMAQIAAKDKQLQLQEVQSNFVMDAMEAWRKSLQQQDKNHKD